MTKSRTVRGARIFLVAILAALGSLLAPGSFPNSVRAFVKPYVKAASHTPRLKDLGGLPLYFVENRGQAGPGISYYLQGRETQVYFSRYGLRINLTRHPDARSASTTGGTTGLSGQIGPVAEEDVVTRSSVDIDFVDANPGLKLTTRNPATGTISYFKGRSNRWKTAVPTWTKLVYENIWPGIDLVYSGTEQRLKYTFVVRPGSDPRRIRMAYRAASSVKINDSGQMEISTPSGTFNDENPVSYQEDNGERTEVATHFVLRPGPDGDAVECGFSIGAYDRGRTLMIDPTMMIYSGFVGGLANDIARGVALDGEGNAYICGMTGSLDFPVTVGPGLTQQSPGSFDAFVAKIRADGSGLVYAGFIGGDQDDVALGIAVDSAGNAYVTGATTSSPQSFPLKVGPRVSYGGGILTGDAFVAKVNSSGTSLDYCGYIGGEGEDCGFGIAVDSGGSAYVTGFSSSMGPASGGTFPATGGPSLVNKGGYDAFVAKITPDGSGFTYAGFIGGSDNDGGSAIAVDGQGAAYITGTTRSTQTTFPVAVGPALKQGGDEDAFVAKVKPDGSGLAYCGFIGGDHGDGGYGIAVDSAGNAYVAGNTFSSEATFPVKVGPGLSYGGGSLFGDAFVAKVKADGASLVYCGYIGGTGEDAASAIAVDSMGNAYVTGSTTSGPDSFPVTGGPGLINEGGATYGDAFIAKVNPGGSALVYCGYLGGADDDSGLGVAVDSDGNAYVAGSTASTEFSSFPVLVGPSTKQAGGIDGFIAKISFTNPGPPPPVITAASAGGKNLTVTGSGFDAGAVITINNVDQNTKNDPASPTTSLIGVKVIKKKKILPGQTVTLQVRNASGALSNQFPFTRPAQ